MSTIFSARTVCRNTSITRPSQMMDASYIFDFAVGLLDISYLSWFLIASHYKLRPSSFDFILKRRDRMQEWRSEMDDLPKTVICITSPFLLFGHIGMGIVDIIMFLPLMGAFLLLHIIVAACLWWIMPLRLRPIRAIHACLQASFCGAKVCLGGIVQLLTMICAYGKARRAEFQYALRQFAPFEQLATIRQHRAKKACATKRSLHSLVVPELEFIRSGILLLQEYAKLRVSALKRSANQLMTPELVAFAQEWRRPAEAEIKRTFRQHLKPENTPVFVRYARLIFLAVKRTLRQFWRILIKFKAVSTSSEIPAKVPTCN